MNNKLINVSEATEKLMLLEEKYNLFELEVEGIYFWKLIRNLIITEIQLRTERIDQIHLMNTKKDKLKKVISVLYNTIMKNPFFRKTELTWIFENPRKVYQEEEWIDPYTHYYIRDEVVTDFTLFESRYNSEYKKSMWSSGIMSDYITPLNIIIKLITKKTPIEQLTQDKIKKLEEELKKNFDLEINVRQKIDIAVFNFKSLYAIYNRLLKIKQPKEIILICSYGKEALIAAAHNNGVKVIEIQHGVIGKEHMGYNFSSTQRIRYFPDELWTFGEYWLEEVVLPFNTIVTVKGYPHLSEFRKKMKPYHGAKKIIFISQGTVGRKLSEISYQVAKSMPEKEFIFKLHPGEFTRWKIDYPILKDFDKLGNTTIIENERSMYELFNESEYVIGVNSTAIFEAIYFGLSPIIIELIGFEYMQVLCNNNHVPLFKKEKEIIDYLQLKQKNDNIDEDYLFKN